MLQIFHYLHDLFLNGRLVITLAISTFEREVWHLNLNVTQQQNEA